MKKILYVLLSLSAVGFLVLNAASAKGEADLFAMASVLERENIMINDWSLNAREKLESEQAVLHKMDQLKEQYPQLEWQISEDEEKWEATAIFPETKEIDETIHILSTVTETKSQAYIIYEANGNGWGEETKKQIRISISERINAIFRGKATIFSCVKGEFDDKIKTSLHGNVNNILMAFQAREIETLKEDSFISTTAYSPLFSEMLKGKAEKMNLQIGIRNQGLGEKTTLVVGTPIITIEY